MPEPLYYIDVRVDGTANTETLEDALTSTEEEPKVIVGINMVEVTAAENHDATIKAYIERECIASMDIVSTLTGWDTDIRLAELSVLEMHHILPVGQSLKVGQVSGAVATDMEFNICYQITR